MQHSWIKFSATVVLTSLAEEILQVLPANVVRKLNIIAALVNI